MSVIRFPVARGGMFGSSRPKVERFELQHADLDAEGEGVKPPAPVRTTEGKPASTHLNAVAEYLEHHGHFASEGISLSDHVSDFFINAEGDINEPTPEIIAAVKRQSEALAEQWRDGKVANPFE